MAGLVMISDDDPVVRHILSAVVTSAGHEVITAENGARCLEIIQERTESKTLPAAMFLDMHLQDMNAGDVIEKVRKLIQPLHLPIILLSANTKEELLKECPTLSPDVFLEKPFTPDVTLEALRSVLAKAEE